MTRWVEEFRAEIADDRRCLLEARQHRAGTNWSFAVAAERTRRYYIERITGFFVCGSVTETERDELLRLVDGLAAEMVMHPHLATVTEAKILNYLLAESHPAGRSKAAFFLRHGFMASSWQVLRDALIEQAQKGTISMATDTEFGWKYSVEGELRVPAGTCPWVRTVWFISRGETEPRLVTAYPAQGGKQ